MIFSNSTDPACPRVTGSDFRRRHSASYWLYRMPVLPRPAGCIRSEHVISRPLRVKDGRSSLSRYRPVDLRQVHYGKAVAVFDARSETLNQAYRMASERFVKRAPQTQSRQLKSAEIHRPKNSRARLISRPSRLNIVDTFWRVRITVAASYSHRRR